MRFMITGSLDLAYKSLIIALGVGFAITLGTRLGNVFPKVAGNLDGNLHPIALGLCLLLSCWALEKFLPLRSVSQQDLAFHTTRVKSTEALSPLALPQLGGLAAATWLATPEHLLPWGPLVALLLRLAFGVRRWHLPGLLQAGRVTSATTAGLFVHDSELASEAIVQAHLKPPQKNTSSRYTSLFALWLRRVARRASIVAAVWLVPLSVAIALSWQQPALGTFVLLAGNVAATACLLRATRFGDLAKSRLLAVVVLVLGTMMSTGLFILIFETSTMAWLLYAGAVASGAWQRAKPRVVPLEAAGLTTDMGYVMLLTRYYLAGIREALFPVCAALYFL